MKKTYTHPILICCKIGIIVLFILNGFCAKAGIVLLPKTVKSENLLLNAAVNQNINFAQLAPKQYANADFDPGAITSSGLKVTYTSSNTAVATIIDNKIHIVGAGITLITASQPGNSNYKPATPVTKSLSVSKSTLRITANSQTRVYGSANTTLTATYTGFVKGDTETSLTIKPTISTTALINTKPGSYAITVKSAVSANYNLVYVNGTITITKATLTIKADDITRVYGSAAPALTVTYTGFVNGETANNLSKKPRVTVSATSKSPSGNYTISITDAVSVNYNIIHQGGTLTIAKKVLTITAQNKQRAFGAANPALTVVYTGLVNGEKAPGVLTGTPILSTTANTASELGNYPIEVSGNVTAANYDVVFANGTLTVGKGTIRVTVVNKVKTYGKPNPAFTFTYAGFANGDNESVITTLPQAPTTTAVITSPTGTYPITTTGGAVSEKYNFVYIQGKLTVGRAVLNIVFNNKTKVYGQPNPEFTYTLNGFVNGDTEASEPFVVAPKISSAETTAGAGVYSIKNLGGYTRNYNLRSVNGVLTVVKANLLISAVNASRAYASPNPAFAATYTGFVNGDTQASIETKPTFTTNATAASVPGIYTLNVGGAASPNYNITYAAAQLTITKGKLFVRAVNQEKIYGGTNPAFTVTYEGFANGDSEASLTSAATATANATTSSVAGTYAITPAGVVDDEYEPVYVNGTLTINKANLTVVPQNASRIYGAANPVFNATYSGFVNGETESVLTTRAAGTTSATAASGVGTYAIAFNGATAANYRFTYNPATLTVTPAALNITANNVSRSYGSANAEFTSTYTGFVNGDTQASLTTLPAYTTTANQLSGVGTYPVSVANAASNNYNITYNPGSLTITKAQLVAKANAQAKAYGDANPAFTVSYSGFVNNETSTVLTDLATVSVASGINASTLPGDYNITPSGGLANNYQLSYATGTLTINKAILTVTAGNATRAYGVANPTFTIAYNGFVLGETQSVLTTQPTTTTTANLNSPAGNYSLIPVGGVSDRYTFNYVNGILSVSKAMLIITANPASRAYGAANPLFTSTYNGFINGDTEASMSTLPRYTTNSVATSGIGQYSITPFGAINNNYDITYNTGTLTVTKAPLIARADNKSKIYGDTNPAFTISYTGFVNNETSAVLTAQATAAIASGVNASTSPGTYAIDVTGGSATNYELSYSPGTLTIGKAIVTVTAANAGRVYGIANPAFSLTYNGFVGTDTQAGFTSLPTATTTATITSPVGTYAIIPAGGSSSNYNFAYNNGTLTIGQATLTVTAENKTKAYGSANPAFTATYSGFINGDTEASLTTKPVFNTTATTASPVGNYTVTPAGAMSGNYNIVYNTGMLAVTRAQLNVIAANKSKTYGAANPAFTVTYSGFVNGDTEAALTAQATASSITTVSSGAGNYAIVPVGGSAANYNMAYTNGTLTVNKAVLTVTANNATRLFNTADPAFTVTYSDFVNGDTENSLTTKPVVTTPAAALSPVGTYALIPGAAVSENYNFTYLNGVLTVTPSSATINFALLPAKVFGDADFEPTATNNVNEPMVYTSSNTEVASIENGKIHIGSAGMATVTAAIAASSNYNQTLPVSQLLIVDKARQTITFAIIPAISKGNTYSLTGVISSSGLPVTLTVDDATVASLQRSILTGLQIGNTTVRASQPGNNNYYPATDVVQNVIVGSGDSQVDIIVHQAVSPNGDGINDTFLIEGIANHPDNRVTLINRNGLKVYESIGYDNVNKVFDGRSNVTKNLLQAGTYFYQIKYIANGAGRTLTGYFVLKY